MLRILVVVMVLMTSPTITYAQSVVASVQIAHTWTGLNRDPLQNPYDFAQIKRVIHGFRLFPHDVAEEFAEKIFANRGGVPSTLCKGQIIYGMSFGNAVVWNGPTLVAWQNARDCTPITVFSIQRTQVVYKAFRVHACKNLGAFTTTTVVPPPQRTGPDYGGIPQMVCPPINGVPSNCC